MKRALEISFTVIITALSAMIINSLSFYFAYPKALYMIGPICQINDKQYLGFDITNYQNKEINKIKVAIPTNLPISEVISSDNIQIEPIPNQIGAGKTKTVFVSGLKSNQLTRLLFPLHELKDSELFSVVNSTEIGLKQAYIKSLKHPFQRAIKEAILASLFYAILIGCFWTYYSFKQKSLHDNFSKIMKQQETAKAELTEVKDKTIKRLRSLAQANKKQNILLLARIRDYSKELSFWRDTIRKILFLNTNRDKQFADKLFEQVMDNLKTYSTLSKHTEDFITIGLVESITSELNKGFDDK